MRGFDDLEFLIYGKNKGINQRDQTYSVTNTGYGGSRMNENRQTNKNQNIILENREKLSISGVDHVDSFNDNTITVLTNKGLLTIKGHSLNISKLNLDDGNVVIEGSVNSIVYSDKGSSKSRGNGLLGKMFK